MRSTFARLSLRQKIVSGFVAVLTLSCGLNVYLLTTQESVRSNLNSLYSQDFAAVRLDLSIQAYTWQANNDIREHILSENVADEEQLKNEIAELDGKISDSVAAVTKMADDVEKPWLEQFTNEWKTTQEGWQSAMVLSASSNPADVSKAARLVSDGNDNYDNASAALQKDVDYNNAQADSKRKSADSAAKTAISALCSWFCWPRWPAPLPGGFRHS